MTAKPGGPDFKRLLEAGGLAELGPGLRKGIIEQTALNNELDSLFGSTNLTVVSKELIRGLILLWHDHFDAAHEISQAIENADGSFVHGILHRREPDYGNAAYWFRRVGTHASFAGLAKRVADLPALKDEAALKTELMPRGYWDPFAYIHLCEKAAGKLPSDARVILLREIQGVETEVLLEHFLTR